MKNIVKKGASLVFLNLYNLNLVKDECKMENK